MKSGRLIEVIRIERENGETISEAGTPRPNWEHLCALRAERVDQSTTEYLQSFGATDEEAVIFRARFFEGIGTADRLIWQDETFNIKQVTPIGRRKGVELRCTRIAP